MRSRRPRCWGWAPGCAFRRWPAGQLAGGPATALFALASTSGFIFGPLVAGSALAAGFDDVLLATLIAARALAALAATRLGRTLPPTLNAAGATP